MITIVQVIVIYGTECSVIVIESKVIVIELFHYNSFTPKFNFIENNQTKKICILTYWDFMFSLSHAVLFIYLFPNSGDKMV